MRFTFRSILAVPVAAAVLALAPPRDAVACGCFFSPPAPPNQTIDVASHRMILSISQTQSTLYDQIKYTGSPASFGWVLPIQGTVTVGVSSDALFATLDTLTAVTVNAPFSPTCNSCNGATGTGGAIGFTSGSSSSSGGVTVIAQGTVGPYETVQLSSTDPMALETWLATNGYPIASAEQSIITEYVSAGFDFLAVKLQPGMGISAMQPIRVTTPGASPVLPLRAVAAGAGATVPVTLWVLGEGRYGPTNYPSFTIDPTKLVWDFASETSNYAQLMQAGFTATNGSRWLVESAQPMFEQSIQSPLDYLVQTTPAESGYGDGTATGAAMAEMADLATVFNGIDPSSFFVTRMLAELPVAALTQDMTLGASSGQAQVPQVLQATQYVNAPTCPPCSTDDGSGGASGPSTTSGGTGGGMGGGMGGAPGGATVTSQSSCALGPSDDASLAGFGFLAALALVARRRRTG
jgi:MYXO-CTERM domain-containing protein